MKSKLWYGIPSVVLVLVTLFSCGKKDQQKSALQAPAIAQALPASLPAAPAGIGWIPDGSRIERTGGVMLITAPKGWDYVGYDQDKELISFVGSYTAKSISCSCNTKGECNPFKATGPGGSTTGCTGDCTNCTMIQSADILGRMRQILEGGYYQSKAPTRNLRENESIPAVFDALLATKPFQDSLAAFYQRAYGGKQPQRAIYNEDGSISAPPGHCLLPISVMGRGLLAIVPSSFAPPIIRQAEKAKASCSCSNGNCALKDRSVLGTGAIWCDGQCSGVCTLTLNGRLPGLDVQYWLQSYAL